MNTNYAGFWLRFVAWILDGLIIGVIQWVIITPILAAIGFASTFSFSDFQNLDETNAAALIGVIAGMFGIAWFIGLATRILYHTFMESSKFQGSLGKMALSIQVTDLAGQRLDFGKALIRNLCKIISNLTMLIGYIIAGFTEKQQALHDIIASTLFVKKQPDLTPKPN